MAEARRIDVHLVPDLATPERLAGGLAVVVDVLRATTTIVHALAAGCSCVRPCAEVDEARRLAGSLPAGKVLLGGERDGKPLPGFDLGNSPGEHTAARCRGRALVLTTTNGTRALLRAAGAQRVLLAAFVNYSAVCEQLRHELRPVHIVCAGSAGEVALEDTLLAGALVECLCDAQEVRLNDGARLARGGASRSVRPGAGAAPRPAARRGRRGRHRQESLAEVNFSPRPGGGEGSGVRGPFMDMDKLVSLCKRRGYLFQSSEIYGGLN